MSVKLFWTQQGQVLGTVTKEDGNTITVENPVTIVAGSQGVSLMPLLMFAEQEVATFNKEELLLNGEVFVPKDELRNHYSSQFGSGVQLLTS